MLFTDHLSDDAILKKYIAEKYDYGSDSDIKSLVNDRGLWVDT